MRRSFRFELLPESLAVCRLDSPDAIPERSSSGFYSWTQAADENSLICPWESAPSQARIEGPFRGLRIVGPIPFDAIGIIAEISALFAEARISLLTISTFDTDYFFVRAEMLAATRDLLTAAGHQITLP